MNKAFKERELSFFLKIILLTLLTSGVHFYLLYNFSNVDLFFPIWQIYIFHFVSVSIIFTVINYKYSKGEKTSVFNYFMVGTLIKMILAFIFLLPLLTADFESKKLDVINFFIPYFIYLAFEIYSINSFLKKSE